MRKLLYFLLLLTIFSCARMGSGPDGGWYDETPPRVVGCTPDDRAVGVEQKKINIYFDEFIKLDNPTENVVISPPQLEQAEIKASGKKIVINLKDSLKQNTTYTVDFSDAISDNNEGNPMGNFTYSFSTGDIIDTMEVSGYVLEAENLEPVKGIMVGLIPHVEYDSVLIADSKIKDAIVADSDSVRRRPLSRIPFLRVARTDASGHFVVKGVKEGEYDIYALQDMDGNYTFSQQSEKMAFQPLTITTGVFDDYRQDTIWRDSLHIKSIKRTQYKHYTPDDVVLRAFTHTQTFRSYVKYERTDANHFSLFFTYGDSILPELTPQNFSLDKPLLMEHSLHNDTLTYWLQDSNLINNDTLLVNMHYRMTDSLGVLQYADEELTLLAKTPYEKRIKAKEKELENWLKKQEKLKKKGEPFDSIPPREELKFEVNIPGKMDPECNVRLKFSAPLAHIDSAKINLYSKIDTLWYKAKWRLEPVEDGNLRDYRLKGEWRSGVEYSLEIDSLAFTDIYGRQNNAEKRGIKVRSEDECGTLMVSIPQFSGRHVIAQLLDTSDKVLKQMTTDRGQIDFFYLDTKEYYLRIIIDDNNNGHWDTGDYEADLSPEEVYYYPKAIECRAKWDITETWNPLAVSLDKQKPSRLTKQKGGNKKTIQNRNEKRARERGVPLPDKLIHNL